MSITTNFQPLYKQVYDALVKRLVDGYWKPADLLPSEFALADELGVSQGTVRKALDQMVAENLLFRQQGKGTYVSEHTQESSLFRFFRFREPGGDSLIPETEVISVARRAADPRECDKLGLTNNTDVVEMVRVRAICGKPTVYERVIQPLAVFPNIDKEPEIPNSLYTLYQEKYGISIVEVRDELRAVSLDAAVAGYLGLPEHSPALMTERSSINLDGRVVEWSQAYSSTENFVYSVSLK